jgi:23S rRNA pseudouridine1911/1915/1917 synthase
MHPQILYEDNHLLVVNKPAGILTQPSGTQQKNLEESCKAWIKETYHKPGNVFLEAVHRLDKPVSGIVVFARTSKALSRLNAFMRDQKFNKIYCAVIGGVMKPSEGVLEHYLVHDEYQSVVAAPHTPQAKLCRLSYRLLKHNDQHSLVEIILETGRYHQIRAQLAAAGYSIVGDVKYKNSEAYTPDAIALHHSALTFPHPTLEKSVEVQAPLPASMLQLVEG